MKIQSTNLKVGQIIKDHGIFKRIIEPAKEGSKKNELIFKTITIPSTWKEKNSFTGEWKTKTHEGNVSSAFIVRKSTKVLTYCEDQIK